MCQMDEQAIVCNIGQFDSEIQVDRLNVRSGSGILVLAEGRW